VAVLSTRARNGGSPGEALTCICDAAGRPPRPPRMGRRDSGGGTLSTGPPDGGSPGDPVTRVCEPAAFSPRPRICRVRTVGGGARPRSAAGVRRLPLCRCPTLWGLRGAAARTTATVVAKPAAVWAPAAVCDSGLRRTDPIGDHRVQGAPAAGPATGSQLRPGAGCPCRLVCTRRSRADEAGNATPAGSGPLRPRGGQGARPRPGRRACPGDRP
jgi:hypothetical protein